MPMLSWWIPCLLVVVVEELQEGIGLRRDSEHIVDVVDLRRLVGSPHAVADDIHLAHIGVGIQDCDHFRDERQVDLRKNGLLVLRRQAGGVSDVDENRRAHAVEAVGEREFVPVRESVNLLVRSRRLIQNRFDPGRAARPTIWSVVTVHLRPSCS